MDEGYTYAKKENNPQNKYMHIYMRKDQKEKGKNLFHSNQRYQSCIRVGRH